MSTLSLDDLQVKELSLTNGSAIAGFLLSLSPLSCILMGWRGAGGGGASDIGAFLAFGGVLMILGSIGEVRCCLRGKFLLRAVR